MVGRNEVLAESTNHIQDCLAEICSHESYLSHNRAREILGRHSGKWLSPQINPNKDNLYFFVLGECTLVGGIFEFPKPAAIDLSLGAIRYGKNIVAKPVEYLMDLKDVGYIHSFGYAMLRLDIENGNPEFDLKYNLTAPRIIEGENSLVNRVKEGRTRVTDLPILLEGKDYLGASRSCVEPSIEQL